mmetsp:Transcript_40593/g.127995  ORF Transcript_40593/g.127995 Transcript_40593/m.127995 type:complete len:293 (-) Transcript_40593:829-1707(-)
MMESCLATCPLLLLTTPPPQLLPASIMLTRPWLVTSLETSGWFPNGCREADWELLQLLDELNGSAPSWLGAALLCAIGASSGVALTSNDPPCACMPKDKGWAPPGWNCSEPSTLTGSCGSCCNPPLCIGREGTPSSAGPIPIGSPVEWLQEPESRSNLEFARFWSLPINAGLECAHCRKRTAGSCKTVLWVSVMTSAVLGSADSSEISPKQSPASSMATCRPRTCTTHLPDSRKNIGPGGYPALMMVVPGPRTAVCAIERTSNNVMGSSPCSIGILFTSSSARLRPCGRGAG